LKWRPLGTGRPAAIFSGRSSGEYFLLVPLASPTTNSHKMSPTTPSTRLSRSTLPLYSSNHSRSKSHLPHPRLLPFPDFPIKSRPTSPAGSPGPSGYRDLGIDAGRLGVERSVMVASGSSDGERGFGSSTSPPLHSPLALGTGSGSGSTPHFILSPASRTRSQTSPAVVSRTSSRVASPLPGPAVTPALARTEGFQPTPLSPPIPNQSPNPRASAIPLAVTTSTSTTAKSPARSPPVKKRSDPPATPPITIAITPVSSAEPLNDHLYQSFLKGSCADVRLWVRKWGIAWHVHRVVLVQTGTLFWTLLPSLSCLFDSASLALLSLCQQSDYSIVPQSHCLSFWWAALILVPSGFFHSLFLGGFSETNGVRSSKGKERATIPNDDEDWHGEDVELQFDDPNITRAAFESVQFSSR